MKNYFSATELENLHLTSLPSCKRLINLKAQKENWPFRSRKGRGGGKEYYIDDLPSNVRAELIQKSQSIKNETLQEGKEKSLANLLKLNDAQIQKAEIKEKIVQEFSAFKKQSTLSNTQARQEFCKQFNDKTILSDSSVRAVTGTISVRTLFDWEKTTRQWVLPDWRIITATGKVQAKLKPDRN